MKCVHLLFLTGSILFASSVFASTAPTKEFIEQTYPEVLCADDSYFVKCFEQHKSRCLAAAQKSSLKCADKIRNMKMASEPSFKIKLGECVGLDLEKQFASNKIGDEKCYSQENW